MNDDMLSLIQVAAEAAVQRSLVQTLVPVIRHGVLIEPAAYGPRIHEVQMDGDTSSIAVHDITTGPIFEVGTRITVLFAPPHQAMAIGQVISPGPVRQQVLQSTAAAISATGVTDMALDDVPMVADETYAIHAHTASIEVASVAAAARWLINLRINGLVTDRFIDIHSGVTGVTHASLSATCFFTPPTTDVYDVDVHAQQVAAGSTVQFEGSSTAKRTLTVTHIGRVPILS